MENIPIILMKILKLVWCQILRLRLKENHYPILHYSIISRNVNSNNSNSVHKKDHKLK